MQLFLGLTAGGSTAEMGWIHFYADSRLLMEQSVQKTPNEGALRKAEERGLAALWAHLA